MINALLKEMDYEAATTRKMLSIVPSDKFDWQPHPKSMTIKQLATHIAELPGWVSMTLHTDGLDFEVTPYQQVEVNNTPELLDYFERTLTDGRASLANADENSFDNEWTLSSGEQVFVRCTKAEMIRSSYSQIVHHRAQLGVCLRLLNVPIPGSYGPSADEQGK
jgi:uncharacterized damage-inducible protein DinB